MEDAKAYGALDVAALNRVLAMLPDDTMHRDLSEDTLMMLVNAYNTNKKAEADRMAEDASDKAKMVLAALDPADVSPTAPTIALEASSAGMLTAKSTGYMMSEDAPDMLYGFRGAVLTMDDDMAVVYSDIEDAKATPIGDIYRSASDPGEPKTYSVTGDGANDSINWMDVKRADEDSTTSGADSDRMVMFAGSVRGVDGMFTCMGASGCEVPNRESNGGVPDATSSTDWSFDPTDPNGAIDIADASYLQFGWWLGKVGDDYEVDVFAMVTGMEARNSGNTAGNDLTGSATYKGGAAGKWAMASTTEDSFQGGHFTATATLTADFDADGDDDATNGNDMDGVSISGTISDFMTGDMSRDSWSVKLMADGGAAEGIQTLDNADLAAGGVTRTTEWKTGGAVDGMGTWSGMFYGGEDDEAPMAVTGEFDAAIADGAIGRLQGAFGASMMDDDM
jgi:hypothetical protein